MTFDPDRTRTYGGWRRTRGIGLLGLGPAATLVMLGVLVVILVTAALSIQSLLYLGPPVAVVAVMALIRPRGTPLALLAIQRLRWWRGTTGRQLGYRAEVVQQHTGVLQLPGTLAATDSYPPRTATEVVMG